MSRINFVLSRVEHGKSFITSEPDVQPYLSLCGAHNFCAERSGSVGRALDWGSKGC